MPAQVMRAAQAGSCPRWCSCVPAVDAVVSHVIRNPDLGARAAMRGYLRFYEPLVRLRGAFVTATFDEVIGGFGAAIERLNARFGTTFVPFEHTPENVARIDREIERDYRAREGSGRATRGDHPPPLCLTRGGQGRGARAHAAGNCRRQLLAEAHAVYRALLPGRVKPDVTAGLSERDLGVEHALGASSTNVLPGFSAISSPVFVRKIVNPASSERSHFPTISLPSRSTHALPLPVRSTSGDGYPATSWNYRSRWSSRPGSRRCRP